ncbi:helix-hairpin-helix domain-containing protein [Methylomarinum sp. Ch1-1]|uniref:Helix-hairpin-helix domain-containing protein n=1 Tax=Methylomarinum roseum TaxID=3067653 RepID=A0AAU7NSN4_9GAMM|nr:helix-hairpin-helix domain-containing protein [Methylomarinum sp. Ch1-1]MDP4520019.1 helix-hairpin-helix domain-containing protein [Methylomarinum sp. Ch1-1]
MKNKEIADKLNEIGELLEQQGANPFRSNAYLRAAKTIAQLTRPATEIIDHQGVAGLIELPAIGEGIARSIYEYVATGRMSRLESLKAGHDPIELFEQIPGIGPTLAHRLIEVLHIDTLEALEVAAHNGRLSEVPGFSANKVEMVQAWLDHVFGYRRPATKRQEAIAEPEVALLLQIDFLYRKKAGADELPKIAPKRFNPSSQAWLPIMHVTKKGWHFTALFSNTPRAHQLQKTDDWVVLFFYDDEHHEGQHTVVTETKGSLKGQRVVRGREGECRDYYAGQSR